MNEQIVKELWATAQNATRDRGAKSLPLFKKFAELIVNRCAAICQNVDGESSDDAISGRQDCYVEIKEHFGILEEFHTSNCFYVGQTFGVCTTPELVYTIWCRVAKIHEGVVYFRVINGAWNGSLLPSNKSLICYGPYGDIEYPIIDIYKTAIPNFKEECYNEAIAWMNDELKDDISPYLERKFIKSDDCDDIPF